jgi:hypothetical protein
MALYPVAISIEADRDDGRAERASRRSPASSTDA